MSSIVKGLVLLVLAISCVLAGQSGPDGESRVAMVAAVSTERLFEIELPAGDVSGFSIDVPQWTGHAPGQKYASATWLSQGYTGVLFRGKGKGLTHIRPGSAEATIIVDRHAGKVRLADLTVHCGSRQGIFFGLAHPGVAVEPLFWLETQNVDVLADGVRTTWGVFGYALNADMRDGKIDVRNGLEHSAYFHGSAGKGWTWVRMTSLSAAEGFKVRSDRTETVWAGPNVTASLTACTFDGWYEPHSSRGGGGVVLQGASANLRVDGCLFRNRGGRADPDGAGPLQAIPSSQRTRAIMVDDGGGDFWGMLDGKPGQGFAAGHVTVRGSGFDVGPGSENLSIVIRVGNLSSGSHRIARSVRILDNGIYGENLQLQISNLAPNRLTIAGNNTEAIAARARALGIDTTFQAKIPLSDRVIPVSDGLRR